MENRAGPKGSDPIRVEQQLTGMTRSSVLALLALAVQFLRIIPQTPIGGVAQLGEHLPCKQGVMGSIPIISTNGQSPPPTNGWRSAFAQTYNTQVEFG